MSSLTFLSLRPILRLLPRSTRSDRHRVLPCDLPAGPTMSTPLDRGSTVPLCAVCIEAGRATEATYQTRDLLCGCDQHIQELEEHGRAAVRRARRGAAFWFGWWPSIDAAPAGAHCRCHHAARDPATPVRLIDHPIHSPMTIAAGGRTSTSRHPPSPLGRRQAIRPGTQRRIVGVAQHGVRSDCIVVSGGMAA